MSFVKNKNEMDSYSLKIIAILAMTIDHAAWAFIATNTPLAFIMHLIGRVTAPIMCFMAAEGFYYTRNIKKYMLRLAVFAIPSAFAYGYFETGKFKIYLGGLGMLYTLLIGLIAAVIWKKTLYPKWEKIITVILLCIISLMGDWPIFAVLWILFFVIYRDNEKMKWLSFTIVGLIMIVIMAGIPMMDYISSGIYKYWYANLMQVGIFLAIPFLKNYNGRRGGKNKSKWFFYVYYPLHLVLLGIVKYYIF